MKTKEFGCLQKVNYGRGGSLTLPPGGAEEGKTGEQQEDIG